VPVADFLQLGAPWLALAFGLGYFLHSSRESVRNRQRDLRQKFRKTLLQGYRQCHTDLFDLGVTDKPQDRANILPAPAPRPESYDKAFLRLETLKLEGLSSPNSSHLEYIQTHLNMVSLTWFALNLAERTGEAEYKKLRTVQLARLNDAERALRQYIRVAAKIDDGSYITYLRYKYGKTEFPPEKRSPIPKE